MHALTPLDASYVRLGDIITSLQGLGTGVTVGLGVVLIVPVIDGDGLGVEVTVGFTPDKDLKRSKINLKSFFILFNS